MSDYVKLNEQTMTREQFEIEKQKLESQKGVKVIEVSKDVYKTRIQG